MGDYLSTPITEKHFEDNENEKVRFGASGMQGWRKEMEDAHVAKLSWKGCSIFIVFDGHGGKHVAQMCADRLVGYIDKHHTTGDYERALTDAFIAMDSYINSAPGWKELEKLTAESGGARMCDGADTAATMGTTCCLVLITPTEIYCANIGDSRAVLSRKGAAVDLSIDHKPEIYSERLRIETAGGYVENNRVNGALNLARSFGDFQYKGKEGFKASEQMVISVPEIKSEKLKDADFIIVACDGIWDCMSSKEAVDFVIANNTDTTSTTKKLSVIVNKMLDTCLAKDIGPGGKGCDNMTCIIIEFKK